MAVEETSVLLAENICKVKVSSQDLGENREVLETYTLELLDSIWQAAHLLQ